MTLPALLPPTDPTRIFNQRTDLARPELRYAEPGMWWNSGEHDLLTGCFPAMTAVTDAELTGADPSTGVWTVTVTPITTQQGSAGADGMAPASISFTAAATALSAVVTGLITAADDSSELISADDLAEWSRFRSYVDLSVSPSGATFLRATSVASGMEFLLEVTAPAGNSSTVTVITAPSTTTVKVGFYVAIDRTRGLNGYNEQGQPYLALIDANTPAADIVGPVYKGADTEPVESGYAFREYDESSNVPLIRYGQVLAYAEKAIDFASGPVPVYVRHTDAGDFLAGMATDQAGAEAGATANVWTMTPAVANDTLYQLEIQYNGEVEVLTYLSDGTAADTEITAGLLAQLNLRNGEGQPLEGITGVDGATLVLTGPADGRSFVATSIGVGDAGEVETTPGVTTHTLLTRGDEFVAQSIRIGSVPVNVPRT